MLRLKIFLILLFTITCNIFAQNKISVEYDGLSFTNKTKVYLIADRNQAFYKETLGTSGGEIDDNSFVLPGTVINEIYQNRATPFTIYLKSNSYSENNKEIEYIIDEIPPLDWDISTSSETIEIQGFKCREARVQFRGSVYVAYFTDEIPIPFGPWKFSGLPGLILQVYSIDNPRNKWEATKIIYPYETTQNTEFDPSIYTLKLKDAVENMDKYNEEKGRAFAAKSGDIYYPIPKHMRRHMAREVKYEWETW